MYNKFEITGKIIEIGEINVISDKFKKREFVIEIPHSSYPQVVMFQLSQDSVNLIDDDGICEGDTVTVSFNLKGRKWTSGSGDVKYFNTLDAWRVTKAEASHSYSHVDLSGDGEDLPF